MSKLLFNIHDLALVLVIVACFMHSLALWLYKNCLYHRLLVCFLCCIALTSFDTLIYWSNAINSEIREQTTFIFFIFKWCLFALPPLLYLFVNAVVIKGFTLQSRHFLHLLPPFVFIVLTPVFYLSIDDIHAAMTEYEILYFHPIYHTYMWWSKIAFIAYGIASLRLLKQYRIHLKEISSNLQGIDGTWLRIMVIGFMTIWLWSTATQIIAQFPFQTVADFMGQIQNYLYFALINSLVFLSLTQAAKIHSLSPPNRIYGGSEPSGAYTDEQINRIEHVMLKRKAYLDPEITLEQLSTQTSLPPKLLSTIINRHFKRNFFEFINYYRVEHAKHLLTSNSALPMLDIMAESGFNSKSAFNRFFKKFTDQTPTQYRQNHR